MTVYDDLGRPQHHKRNQLILTTNADGSAIARKLDGNGNLIEETDALAKVTRHSYDRENRKTSVSFAGATTRYSYDKEGNLITEGE